MLVLGYDPGGDSGVAVLDCATKTTATTTVASVDDAILWFRDRVGSRTPAAVGIDAILSWATGTSGWRPMDEYLRKTYPAVRNSVISSNSAFGAMGIQGIALAMRLRSLWPRIRVNETHPKVLVYAMRGERYGFTTDLVQWAETQVGASARVGNSDELDALLSAVVTAKALARSWKTRDLMKLAPLGGLLTPVRPVTYRWPRHPPDGTLGKPSHSESS